MSWSLVEAPILSPSSRLLILQLVHIYLPIIRPKTPKRNSTRLRKTLPACQIRANSDQWVQHSDSFPFQREALNSWCCRLTQRRKLQQRRPYSRAAESGLTFHPFLRRVLGRICRSKQASRWWVRQKMVFRGSFCDRVRSNTRVCYQSSFAKFQQVAVSAPHLVKNQASWRKLARFHQ
jgi:hypothetical protein